MVSKESLSVLDRPKVPSRNGLYHHHIKHCLHYTSRSTLNEHFQSQYCCEKRRLVTKNARILFRQGNRQLHHRAFKLQERHFLCRPGPASHSAKLVSGCHDPQRVRGADVQNGQRVYVSKTYTRSKTPPTGRFSAESITEDFLTGLMILPAGYRNFGIPKQPAHGLCRNDWSAHVAARAVGTAQCAGVHLLAEDVLRQYANNTLVWHGRTHHATLPLPSQYSSLSPLPLVYTTSSA